MHIFDQFEHADILAMRHNRFWGIVLVLNVFVATRELAASTIILSQGYTFYRSTTIIIKTKKPIGLKK